MDQHSLVMKEEIRKVLGFDMPMLVYESVEEGDKDAGKEGAVLAECNNNLLYRGAYADARDFLCTTLEEVTGIERKMKASEKKDKQNNPIMVYAESEETFVERVLATNGNTVTALNPGIIEAVRARTEEVEETVDGKVVKKEVLDPIRADIKGRVRGPAGPKKLPETYRKTAEQCIANNNHAKVIALIKKDLNKDVVMGEDHTKNVETLGWAIRDHILWKEKQAQAAYATGAVEVEP